MDVHSLTGLEINIVMTEITMLSVTMMGEIVATIYHLVGTATVLNVPA